MLADSMPSANTPSVMPRTAAPITRILLTFIVCSFRLVLPPGYSHRDQLSVTTRCIEPERFNRPVFQRPKPSTRKAYFSGRRNYTPPGGNRARGKMKIFSGPKKTLENKKRDRGQE